MGELDAPTSNSPSGELDEPYIQLTQWLVGLVDSTCHRTSWTWLIQLARWRVSNLPDGELDRPIQLTQQRIESVLSNSPSGELDQSHTMHSRVRNSLLRVSIKLSLVSSRSELSLKLYDKNDKNLFSRISSNRSYKR